MNSEIFYGVHSIVSNRWLIDNGKLWSPVDVQLFAKNELLDVGDYFIYPIDVFEEQCIVVPFNPPVIKLRDKLENLYPDYNNSEEYGVMLHSMADNIRIIDGQIVMDVKYGEMAS